MRFKHTSKQSSSTPSERELLKDLRVLVSSASRRKRFLPKPRPTLLSCWPTLSATAVYSTNAKTEATENSWTRFTVSLDPVLSILARRLVPQLLCRDKEHRHRRPTGEKRTPLPMYQYVVSGIMHPTKYIITSKYCMSSRSYSALYSHRNLDCPSNTYPTSTATPLKSPFCYQHTLKLST